MNILRTLWRILRFEGLLRLRIWQNRHLQPLPVDDGGLDYDDMIHLDAEDLAEGGIVKAYQEMAYLLRAYVPNPEPVTEELDDDVGSYAVFHRGIEYSIYHPALGNEDNSWGNATYAFFQIVNSQLEGSTHRFYAVNGGNDLDGIFLTPEECEAAKQRISKKKYWPYLPTSEPGWYGQFH